MNEYEFDRFIFPRFVPSSIDDDPNLISIDDGGAIIHIRHLCSKL